MFKPLIIGICGGSCSGKTTFANFLYEELGADRALVIRQDSYYKGESRAVKASELNFDHPDSIDFKLLAENLNALSNLEAVNSPLYDFIKHVRSKETLLLAPKPIILVEGILILHSALVRNLLGLSVFIECAEATRRSRRLMRDVMERGRDRDDILRQLRDEVFPMHDDYVEPSQNLADITFTQQNYMSEVSGSTSKILGICNTFLEACDTKSFAKSVF